MSKSPPIPNSETYEAELNPASVRLGSSLVRSLEIESAFEYLLSLPRRHVLDKIRKESVSSTTRTREEVLVSLCRVWNEMGETDDAWAMAAVLTTRIRGKVARTLQIWRLDLPPALRDEVIEEITVHFYETLFDTSDEARFLEVRFWVGFDCDLLDIIRRRRREQDSIPAFNQPLEDDEYEREAEQIAGFNQPRIGIMDPEMSALISEALMGLPDMVRHAYVLKHFGGFPEESFKGDSGVTIASALNVSGRTVRNYLAKADEFLMRWREGILLEPKRGRKEQSYGG